MCLDEPQRCFFKLEPGNIFNEPSGYYPVNTTVLYPSDAAEAQDQELSDSEASYLPDGRFPYWDSLPVMFLASASVEFCFIEGSP